MHNRKIWFYSSLIVMLLTVILLITGSPLLNITLDDDDAVPLGTFITWFGIISLPLSINWGIIELRNPKTYFTRYLAILLRIMLVIAVLWMPICYFLSGNLSFSFNEKDTFQGGQLAMRWFWRFSYGLALAPILLLIIYWISLLMNRKN